MSSTRPHGAEQYGVPPNRRRNPGPAAPALMLLGGLAAVLLLIALYVFRSELAALLEWGRSSDPWWRP